MAGQHELSDLNYVGTKISNIDYEIFEYETNSDGVYTLTDRTTKYATGVQINNGKAYMQSQLWPTDVTIDNSTIFVDVQNNKAYTGYSEVPDVSHAKIAYVLKGDNDRAVAEISTSLKATSMTPTLSSSWSPTRTTILRSSTAITTWSLTRCNVDGRKTTGLFVSYDAVRDAGYTPGIKASMEEMEGKVFKALKSIDGKYITEIELVTNWDPAAVVTGSVWT